MQTTIDIPTLPSSQDVEYETSAAPTRQKRSSVGGPTSPTGCKRAALNEITNQESESQVSLKVRNYTCAIEQGLRPDAAFEIQLFNMIFPGYPRPIASIIPLLHCIDA